MVKKWFAVLAMVLLILAGCSQKKEVANEEPQTDYEEDIQGEQPEEGKFSYPLTGIQTDVEPSNRAVAVMVNNHPKARPQSGLQQADLVYEVLAEGDVTRFLAIFESEKPERIGPVRSAREYYIELAKGYDSLFIAHGYSPSAKELLDSGYIDHLNGMRYDGTLFKRVDFRKPPHNSYITYKNILEGAEENRFNMDKVTDSLPFLNETQLESLAGQEAKDVKVSYGNEKFDAQYVYDSESRKYHRFSAGEETVDFDSEEAVRLDNVLIVEMEHEVLDNQGRRAIDLMSGGRGYLIQHGILNEVEWKNVDGKILPFKNGKEAGFVPGKTWINIVPDLDRVTF